jgi:hypothetical protein
MGLNVWFAQVVRNFYPVIIWLCLALVALVHVFGKNPIHSTVTSDAQSNSVVYHGESQDLILKSGRIKGMILN